MKGNGRMISKMDMGLKFGQMGLNMKVTIIKEKKMVKALIHGLINLSIRDNGQIIKYMGMVFILGRMEENMK